MARSRRGQARLGFCQVSSVGPLKDPTGVFLGSVTTGTHVEHYRRTWTMGPTAIVGSSLLGTIGVQSATGGHADLWDDDAQDFVGHDLPEGVKTPWVADLRSLRVAFQLKPRIDKRQGFAGALRKLLNESAGADLWDVEPEMDPTPWEEWIARVDRITRLTVRLDRPNPQYEDREEAEELIEESHAEKVRIAFEAREGESLDPDGPELLKEGIEHADAGYGRYTAVAEVGGGTAKFDSKNRSAPPELEVPADHETGDAFPSALRRAVGDDPGPDDPNDATPYVETGDDGDGDEDWSE